MTESREILVRMTKKLKPYPLILDLTVYNKVLAKGKKIAEESFKRTKKDGSLMDDMGER